MFSWISLKAFRSKVMAKKTKLSYFFAALALSAVRRLRVHSDLLDGTAFEALSLVVCAKGLMYEKSVDTSLYPSTS